jgi:uncharacterized peroxidase-related enzyme
MSRTAIPARDDAPAEAQQLLDAIAKQLRFVPNMYRAASTSPNALTGMMSFKMAISSALDPRTLTRIALAVSQINECQYCLSLHTHLGMNYSGLSPVEMMLNRQGISHNKKTRTLLSFVQKVVRERGKVTKIDLQSMRDDGYSDEQIVEIVTASVYYVFTNLINNVFDIDVDFPKTEIKVETAVGASRRVRTLETQRSEPNAESSGHVRSEP